MKFRLNKHIFLDCSSCAQALWIDSRGHILQEWADMTHKSAQEMMEEVHGVKVVWESFSDGKGRLSLNAGKVAVMQ